MILQKNFIYLSKKRMYPSIVTIQLKQQRLERLKNEISENIKLVFFQIVSNQFESNGLYLS
jgi:hypothetical protein